MHTLEEAFRSTLAASLREHAAEKLVGTRRLLNKEGITHYPKGHLLGLHLHCSMGIASIQV